MRRRLVDVAAILSLFLWLVACGGLIRSHWIMEQWAMPQRPAPPVAGSSYLWVTQRFVESAFAQLRVIETTTPLIGPRPTFAASSSVRYYHRSFGDLYVNFTDPAFGFTPRDKVRVVLPGLECSAIPAQLGPAITGNTAPGRPIEMSGFRSFSVSWWLLVLLAAVLPTVWGRCRWLQHRRAWRVRHNRCPECGYDLRGSAERCPECGLERMEPASPEPTAAA